MHDPFGLQDFSDGTPIYSMDPVCEKPVDEARAAGHAPYAGQTYYFCSKDCKHAFEEDPRRYLGRPRVMRATL
jgi:YHS domain-containing protein